MANRDNAYYALIALFLLLVLNQLVMIFSFRLDRAGIEDGMVYYGLELIAGKVYGDPEKFPFQVMQYPPLYFYVTYVFSRPFEWLTGDEVRAFYIGGRIISLAGCLGALALIAHYFRQVQGYSRRMAWLPALLGMLFFTTHMFAVRPDGLKIFMETCLFYCALQAGRTGRAKWAWGWMVLAAMALMIKQDVLVQLAVIASAFLFYRNYKAALLWPLAALTAAIALLLLFTGGSFTVLYKNLLLGLTQGIDPVWAKVLVVKNLPALLVVLLWTAAVVLALYRSQRSKLIPAVLLLYAGAHLPLLKWGSNINYLIDLQLACLALLVFFYGSQRRPVFLYLAVFGSLTIFANNFSSGNTTLANPWVERQARTDYLTLRSDARALKAALENEGCEGVILFNTKVNLFLHEKNVLGTLYNEYPDLLEDVSLSELTMPDPIYRYVYGCPVGAPARVCLAVPEADAARQLAYLRNIFQDGDELVLGEMPFALPDWDLFTVNCKQ